MTNTLSYPPGIAVYDRPVDVYVRQHGEWFTPQPRPKGVRKRKAGQCYANAMQFVFRQHVTYGRAFWYVEGYALCEFGWVEHAWAADADLNVIDQTWDNPERSQYFGAKFTAEEYSHAFAAKSDGIDSLFSLGTVPEVLHLAAHT